MALVGSSLQVLAAIAVVIILFIIAYYIFNREAVNAATLEAQLKSRVDVFKGVKDMATIPGGETYNTVNDRSGLYMPLKPSVNQEGGIEFTYNFWLYQDQGFQSPSNNNRNIVTDNGLSVNDIVLLLKGTNKVTEYKNLCGVNKKDIYLKCPLIKLENSGDALTVEFNTEKSADVVHEGARNTCTTQSSDWNDKNSHKVSLRGIRNKATVFDKKWFMVTIVIQDTYPSDPLPFRNKVRVHIYINGVLELDQYVDNAFDQVEVDPSVLKPNDGNLYVMPSISWKTNNNEIVNTLRPSTTDTHKVMMADLSYFNYVVNSDDVLYLYKDGFNKFYAASPKGTEGETIYEISYSDGKTRQLKST